MTEHVGHGGVVDGLLAAGAFYGKVLDVAEEAKVLKEDGGVFG